MRIAVLAPVWFPVPPTGYGGIEWVVWLLADGLVDAGHDVTLFASGDSRTEAKLEAVYPTSQSEHIGNTLPEIRHALHCFERADEFDVINDHSGLAACALGGIVDTPFVHTVHGTPVIATRRGAVPEVIEDGVSGIVVDDYREMPAALPRADELDPKRLRQYVEERFSPPTMVAAYVAAYRAARERVRAAV